MAITYTDDVKTVIDGLQTLAEAEFAPIPIRVAREFEEQYLGTKGEYIRLWPVNIEQVSRVASGVYRDYIIDVVFYFNKQRYRTEKLLDEIVTPEVERFERLFDNNHTYGTGGTWFGIDINTDHNSDEELENIHQVKLELTVHRGSFF